MEYPESGLDEGVAYVVAGGDLELGHDGGDVVLHGAGGEGGPVGDGSGGGGLGEQTGHLGLPGVAPVGMGAGGGAPAPRGRPALGAGEGTHPGRARLRTELVETYGGAGQPGAGPAAGPGQPGGVRAPQLVPEVGGL